MISQLVQFCIPCIWPEYFLLGPFSYSKTRSSVLPKNQDLVLFVHNLNSFFVRTSQI